MNVGYGMIGVILLDVAINLICLLVTGVIALFVFIKKLCCRKSKRSPYEVNPDT